MTSLIIPNIEDSIEIQEPFATVTERYYTERYVPNVNNLKHEDHLLLFHSNRICLITLSPMHPVFKEKIVKINYQVGDVDRSQNKVRGKGKKGGQYLHENSILCSVECEGGKSFKVTSCIQGKLVEINEILIDNPQLFVDSPKAEGYLAIALPNIKMIDQWKEKYLTQEKYAENFNVDEKLE